MEAKDAFLLSRECELNGTRENPAAYKKHVEPNDNAELWLHHAAFFQSRCSSHDDDPNYPGFQFENLFEKRWGITATQGEMYNAYKLVKVISRWLAEKHFGRIKNKP